MVERREAFYIISVAAELAGVHPQTLRIYEGRGLINPYRTPGGTRRYSPEGLGRSRWGPGPCPLPAPTPSRCASRRNGCTFRARSAPPTNPVAPSPWAVPVLGGRGRR